MAKADIRIKLIPDTKELDKALKKPGKLGLAFGGGNGEGKSEKTTAKGVTKGLGIIGAILGVLSSLDFIIKPVFALFRAILTLLFLPLIPIMKPALKAMADALPKLIELSISMSDKIQQMVDFFSQPPAKIAEDIFNLENLKKAAIGFVKFFFNLGQFIGEIISPIVIFFVNVGKVIGEIIVFAIKRFAKFFFDVGVKIGERLITAFNSLKDLGKNLWNIIKDAFVFVKNTIINVIKSVANTIISLLNILPGVGIPHLANGGIVTRPTLAVVGEAGPEAVIPLNKASGFGGGITVNINNPIVREDRDLKRLADAVSKQLQRSGQRGF